MSMTGYVFSSNLIAYLNYIIILDQKGIER